MTSQEKVELVRKTAQDLGEHLEHVQIMATWNIDGESHSTFAGGGNWFARQGLAREFIN